MMKVILNGEDITSSLSKVTIHEGTQSSDVTIVKLYYKNGKVDTKVLLPFDLKDHVVIRKHEG